jgi:hypothetical protein
MSNVLDDEKQQQIVALGRLRWTFRRIQAATGVGRETVGGYLRAAGVTVRARGRPGEGVAKPAISGEVSTDSRRSKPAIAGAVSADTAHAAATRAPSASACEPYRELITEALQRGRNAVAIWQDLVDDHGFPARYASVRRFVVALRGAAPAEARVVITTAPGEEAQVDYGGDGLAEGEARLGSCVREKIARGRLRQSESIAVDAESGGSATGTGNQSNRLSQSLSTLWRSRSTRSAGKGTLAASARGAA